MSFFLIIWERNKSYEYGSNIAQPPVRPCDEYLDLDFRGSMTFVLIQIVIAVLDVFRFERCDYDSGVFVGFLRLKKLNTTLIGPTVV